MDKKSSIRFGFLSLMVIVAFFSRLFPHPPNFTAIGATALFGAAYFSRKYLAFIVPLLAMWLSDLMLNNMVYAKMYPESYQGFSWFGNIWVYASFALIVVLGFRLLKKLKPLNILGASLSASILFFLITNFGVWMGSPFYPQTLEGLMLSFMAGIPFFWNTLFGDMFFIALLFGLYELAKYRIPVLQRAGVKA